MKLDEKPVGQVAREMEDVFRRAVPEAKPDTVDLFVRRQLIRASPAAWQLRLKEAEIENLAGMVSKIQVLQLARDSERPAIAAKANRVAFKAETKVSGGKAGDRSTKRN